MANYLFAKPYKYFRSKRKANIAHKRKLQEERQKNFRKGFQHSSNVPKSFDVKPNLPSRGTSKSRTIKRRLKENVF